MYRIITNYTRYKYRNTLRITEKRTILIRRCVISKYTRIYLLTRYRYYHGPRWTEARAISLPESETKRVGRRASLLAFAITSNPFSVRYSWPVSCSFFRLLTPTFCFTRSTCITRTSRSQSAQRHRWRRAASSLLSPLLPTLFFPFPIPFRSSLD